MQWSQHGSTSTGEPTAQSRAVASIASVDAPNTSTGKLKYCLDVSDTVDNMIFTAPDKLLNDYCRCNRLTTCLER